MAHYISGLIHDAENANLEDRPGRLRACSDAILNLWEHRHSLKRGRRPCGDLEPLLRTLESLDPESDTPRYERLVRRAVKDDEEDGIARSWLDLVEDLDYSARVLILYCLTQAAQATINQSAEWVALAKAAGAADGGEYHLVRVISGEAAMLKTAELEGETRKRIEDRTKRLEAFAQMAIEVASQLRKGDLQ